jgi:hypothetical protein
MYSPGFAEYITLGVRNQIRPAYSRKILYTQVFQIDANLINAHQKLPDVNKLEKWCEDEVILINMSSVAHAEAQAGNSPARIRKASTQIFTATQPVEPTDPIFKQVEEALFPGGAAAENQRNDVRIVCEAAKYQAILVTADGASKSQPGGILGNREKLPVQVMSPEEAVVFVESKIRERDEFNLRVAQAGFKAGSGNGWSTKHRKPSYT